MFLTFLDVLRISLCLVCLSYASWSDLKERGVSDLVWIVFTPPTFVLTLLYFYLLGDWGLMISSISSASMMIAVAFTLSYLKFFGSADALALTFVSLAMPSFPSIAPILPVVSIRFSFLCPFFLMES